MIIDALSFVANGILSLIVELFPVADTDTVSFVSSQFTGFNNIMAGVNWFFPVDTFYHVAGYIFAIEGILLIFSTSAWILENITVGLFKKP